jgi:uroporphyrinogen decarboxylase
VIEHPVETESDILKLKTPDPIKDGRMPLYLGVVKEMHCHFACLNVAYIIGPYTLAGLLNGASRVIKNVLKNPKFLKELLEFTMVSVNKYAQALIEAGADAICILEPTATLLSPIQFDEFSGLYVKKIVDKCNVPVILHICGNTTHLIGNMISTGIDGISLDSMVDFAEIKKIVPEEIFLIGNLDPVNVIAYGDKTVVENNIKILLQVMNDRNNFVLSTGCDLPEDADLHNIQLMFNLARGENRKG